jgi:glucose/arabinose dehydrogenase/mono/diheme cytochrome c family protein/regulation of enolase protein 1 (concanavalin A-like superfamily)
MSFTRLLQRLGACVLLFGSQALLNAQDYGLATRPPFSAFAGGNFPDEAPTFSGNWSAVVAFPNLTFLNPMGLIPVPGTNQLAVWEREGRVYIFENDPQTSAKTLVLDVSNQCQGWDDSGLMGIAFHPDFATNRQIFVYYTWVPPGTVQGSPTSRPSADLACRDRLVRYTFGAQGIVNPASETILIDQVSSSVWHNGGGMFFHPDNGFLYLTNGDDANGGNSQRIDRGLHSGVLRIDVDQRGGAISHPIPRQPLPAGSVTANYYIPNDNPFVGEPDVMEEFYALGLRSPHRMTIDPVTKRIFIGDVGGGAREEVSVIEPTDPAGLNFQWDRIEGAGGDLTGSFIGSSKRPIIDYPRNDGRAVIGGYIYRGTEFASDLAGKYIFGDNITGTVWYLDESSSPPVKVAICTLPFGPGPNAGSDYTGLSSFGHDQNNELYLCQLSSTAGRIYKFSRTGPPAVSLPPTLSASGLFSNLATLTPATGFLEYSVNSPFWSDGAKKKRWFAVPTGGTIGYAPSGEWTFPEGSMWLKHFDLPVDLANPLVTRRLETRVLVRDTAGHVYGASYKWRADLSDADLIMTGETENITIDAPPVVTNYTSQDIGGPTAGSTTDLGSGQHITAGGDDIWGNTDQFRFVHETISGDFDVIRRVEALTEADPYTKAGLMARESLDANSRHVFALVFPSNAARNNNTGGYEFQSRDTTGGESTAIYPPLPQPLVNYPDTWLRLKRSGDTFTAYSGTDGVNWSLFATKTLVIPSTLHVGLAVTSHNGGATTTAVFRNLEDRVQPWYFPGRADCMQCHTQAAGGVLGMKSRQNNFDRLFPETGVIDNQLRAWNHVGLFTPTIDEASIPGLLRSVPLDHPTASLEERVRSYIDSNCASCHRPGGVNAFWDARLDTPLESSGIINGTVQNLLGVAGSRVVAPQDLPRSILHRRMGTATEPYRMPPLGKNVVDQAGVAAVAAWISSLTPSSIGNLPVPWNHSDIGPVNLAGDASSSGGIFNLSASGNDIWGSVDGLHYVYQTLTGDGEIIAHVSGLSAPDPWTKVGVMIRESLLPGSTHAMTVLSGGQGANFQYREIADGGSGNQFGGNVGVPYWVRIKREGNLFTSSISSDGTAWQTIGTVTIPMRQQVYLGLCLTSHNNGQLATAAIGNVSVSGGVIGVSVDINFQLAGAPVPSGFFEDGGAIFGSRGNGQTYGWNLDNSANHRDRDFPGSPDQQHDTFTHLQKPGGPWFWEIAVPNGRYHVRAVSGDPLFGDGRHHVVAEGVTVYDAPQPAGPNSYLDETVEILVLDGRLTINAGANGENSKLNYIEIDPVVDEVSVTLVSPVNNGSYLESADIVLEATASTIVGSIAKVEFYDGSTKLGEDNIEPYSLVWKYPSVGGHSISAKAINSGGNSAETAVATVTVTPLAANGLVGEYYPASMALAGTPLYRQDASVNFNWADVSPLAGIGNDNYSVRWKGRVQPLVTGDHVFTTSTDDGVRLHVNGVLVIDQWIDQGTTAWSSPAIALVAGQYYDIEIEYFENGGAAVAQLSWTRPGEGSQIIPTARLTPPQSPWNLWREDEFTPSERLDPLVCGEDADPDHDGITNLMEYAMGLPPRQNTRVDLPTMSRAGSLVTLTYRKSLAASDAFSATQVSTDLTSWSSIGVNESVTATVDGIQTVQAQFIVPENTPELFLRVLVVK